MSNNIVKTRKTRYIGRMNLKNICIILDRPDESRNIGAACRAMANNGISCLRIIGKKEDYDEERVRILSIHAYNLWQNAQFFNSITEATADCTVSAATTRRKGKKRKGKLFFPEEFAMHADRISDNAKVAIVFGNERTGLTDEEVDECTMAVTIPSCDDFPSLNLSHAVQIMCYHIFRAQNKERNGYTPINLERLGSTVNTIADKLSDIGFFSITGRDDMERFWKEVLSRASLSEGEAQYIEKIFTKAAGLSKRKTAGIDNSHK